MTITLGTWSVSSIASTISILNYVVIDALLLGLLVILVSVRANRPPASAAIEPQPPRVNQMIQPYHIPRYRIFGFGFGARLADQSILLLSHLDSLYALCPHHARSQQFIALLSEALAMRTTLPHSLRGRNVLLVLPAIPKGTYYHLSNKRVVRKPGAPVPQIGELEAELHGIKRNVVWYFAADIIGRWVIECGGNLQGVLRSNAPPEAFHHAAIAGPGELIPLTVCFPLTEVSVTALNLGVQIWTLEKMLSIMRGRAVWV